MKQSPITATQRNAIQDWLDAHEAQQRVIGSRLFTVRFHSDDAEKTAMKTLGLCDLSGFRKLVLKGRDAESWLRNANVDVPKKTFESLPLADGGVIVRLGGSEFFLESGIRDEFVSTIARQLQLPQGQVFPLDRDDATFLLTGSRALTVLSQTCGIDFRDVSPRKALLTRMAGVNCCILPDTIDGTSSYRIWVDPGYALFLWETLIEICQSLDGSAIGAGCIYPELLA